MSFRKVVNLKTIHLWVEPPLEKEGQITAAVTVEHIDGSRDRLWYRLSAEQSPALTSSADPFVIGTSFLVMEEAAKAGCEVSVMAHGAVSPSLIRNLEEFQMAWSAWLPEIYGRAEIRGEPEREASEGPAEETAVMCFSGGLDSAFTAYRHSSPGVLRFPYRLKAGVMVHGMDFDLGEGPAYLKAEERSRRILASLGLPLIRMTTNYQEVVPRWPHSHGAAVASCLSLLQGQFNLGLIAQTMTYRNNDVTFEGVNPVTDSLFSSNSFRFVPDGAGFERTDKIRLVKDWPELLANLHVCWQGKEEKPENCCCCEKCIRTILQFRVLELGLPPCFPHDVADEQILNMNTLLENRLTITYEPLLKEARARSISGSWVDALEQMIIETRRRLRLQKSPRWKRAPFIIWGKLRKALVRA